jgi:hypothetical protein
MSTITLEEALAQASDSKFRLCDNGTLVDGDGNPVAHFTESKFRNIDASLLIHCHLVLPNVLKAMALTRDAFSNYAAMHLAKGNTARAATNEKLARECQRIITEASTVNLYEESQEQIPSGLPQGGEDRSHSQAQHHIDGDGRREDAQPDRHGPQ